MRVSLFNTFIFFCQAEDGIRDLVRSRGLGDVYKRQVCNKRTIESLIKGGAFDGLGEPRMGLLQVHEEYVDAFVAVKRQEAIGQDSLFGSFGDDSGGDSGGDLMGLASVPAVEGGKSALLSFEREMPGLYAGSFTHLPTPETVLDLVCRLLP